MVLDSPKVWLLIKDNFQKKSFGFVSKRAKNCQNTPKPALENSNFLTKSSPYVKDIYFKGYLLSSVYFCGSKMVQYISVLQKLKPVELFL